jgi:Tfp pilus assembly protein PilF
LLLQGISLWNRRSGVAIRQAIALFERAIARDAKYARAHAWLGMANNTLPFYDDTPPEPYLYRALAADDRALALDSTVTEAWASSGSALMTLGRNREAHERLQRALAMDSTFATNWGWSGINAVRRGDFEEALRRTRRAAALEPASLISRMQVGQVLNIARRYREADSVSLSVLALDSSFGIAWVQLAEALAGQGRLDEAIEIMEKRASRLEGVRPSEIGSVHAWMLAVAGRSADARAVLDRLRVRFGGRLPPVAAAAAALEELGDHEAAVALMTEAVAQHDPWLWYSRKSRYDKLRKDPRVAALLAPLESW